MTLAATRRLPAPLAAHAREFLAGDRVPVQPRSASTVVLIRSGASGPLVYLLRRHRGMAFAAGMYAFPGGTVDPRDGDQATAWSGPTPADWAARLRCDEALARSLVCAAVRETFEESGVLLAGPSATSLVDDTTDKDWERDRAALVDRSLAFADLLQRRSLVLRTDLLAPWAHWITPEFEPRRYDTHFFLAAVPPGQRARDVSGEADAVTWMPPQEAMAAVSSGEMSMLPPTYITLAEMAGFASTDEALRAAADRRIVTVLPSVEIVGEDALLTIPDDVVP